MLDRWPQLTRTRERGVRRGFKRRHDLDLFPLGWAHLVASLTALAVGMLVLLRPKDTSVHERRGRVYALALLVTGGAALGIYRRRTFFFPHWLAIAALVVTTAGVLAAHFKKPQKAWLHLTCLLTSLYILVGGGVNEIFLRVDFLHRLAPTLNSPAVGSTRLGVIIVFLALIGHFNVVLRVRRERSGAFFRMNLPRASASTWSRPRGKIELQIYARLSSGDEAARRGRLLLNIDADE